MNRIRRPHLAGAIASLVAIMAAAAPAGAQIVYPGDTRVEMSDVTGPPLTSGDLLGPGTVRSFTCPVAWGVRTVSDAVAAGLREGTLAPVAEGWSGGVLPAGIREDLLQLLGDGEGDDEAEGRLTAALAPPDLADSDAREAAEELVERLDGLLSNAARLRPERPGHRTATQLSGAVGAYNRYLQTASGALLADAPQALVAIHAVLTPLVIAALENDGRPITRRVSDEELACAAPPAAPEPPSPPLERATVVCVMDARGLRAMGAIVLASGDTVVAVEGRRIPLAEAFAASAAYAVDAPWYAQGDAITVNDRTYIRFGLPRLAATDADLRRVGEYGGVPLFTEPGVDHLIVPVRPDCLVQEYRPERVLRPRG